MVGFYYFRHLKSILGCKHAVTQKCESEPYAFSMALHTGEAPQSIMKNRKKMKACLEMGRDTVFVFANQTHGDQIAVIDEHCNRGWEEMNSAVKASDALITNRKHIVLGILTADCVPVLLMDTKRHVIAAIHAGWRGSKAHITAKCIAKMSDIFSCEAQDILAGIGPAIGQCCYEVDSSVADSFHKDHKVLSHTTQRYMLDLAEVNRQQLLDAGLLESHIEMSHLCTGCNRDRFFSYRKEQGCSGRFISMIGLID